MNINSIKDRIRKLFNLASNDAAAEGEISNALKAARELMLAHQLSEDDVLAEPEDLRCPEEIAAATEYGTAKSWADRERVPRWQGILASAVANFVATVNVYRDNEEIHRAATGFVRNDGKLVSGWIFYGPHDDCLLASELHQELLLTCATAAKLKYGGNLMTGASRDYCDGFASGLYRKVQQSIKEVREEAERAATPPELNGKQCAALAVVRAASIAKAKRDYAVDWLKREKGITLHRSSGYGRQIRDDEACAAGKTDGDSQSLSKQRVARIGGRT